MLEFADELEPLGTAFTRWAQSHEPTPIWLADVELAPTPRLLGVFVTPATRVLGLRPWDDADDGGEPFAYALFDVEKMIRMALHQSGLAFEALVSPTTWGEFPAREVVRATVTSNILHYYRDVTAALADGKTEAWRWRSLLTGALIARDGVVSQSLPTLCDALSVADAFNDSDYAKLRTLLEEDALPARPTDYDYVNDLVVSLRLEGA